MGETPREGGRGRGAGRMKGGGKVKKIILCKQSLMYTVLNGENIETDKLDDMLNSQFPVPSQLV